MASSRSGERFDEPELIDAFESALPVHLEKVSRRVSAVALALGVVLVVLIGLGWTAANSDSALTSPSTTAPPTVPTSLGDKLAAPRETTIAGNIAWPDPPADHSPHVIGRPGSQLGVRPWFEAETLIYVNDIGRPTVIDLTTGDQREVVVAADRQTDRFLVEGGRIVTEDGEQTQFPRSQRRPFQVTVYRTPLPLNTQNTALLPPQSRSGPTLCLDLGGCEGLVMTQGGLSLVSGTALVIDDGGLDPVEIIARLLKADSWTTDGRWTIYLLSEPGSAEGPGETMQIPSPMATSLVWIISDATS